MRPGFWLGSGSTAAAVFAVLASAAAIVPDGFARLVLLALSALVLVSPVATVAVGRLRSFSARRSERVAVPVQVPVLSAMVDPPADATIG